MIFYFGVCLRLWMFFDIFDCGSCREKLKLYNVRNVCEYLVIYWLHTQYEQEQLWKVYICWLLHCRSTGLKILALSL
jgi:hypothetical protein